MRQCFFSVWSRITYYSENVHSIKVFIYFSFIIKYLSTNIVRTISHNVNAKDFSARALQYDDPLHVYRFKLTNHSVQQYFGHLNDNFLFFHALGMKQ